MTTINVLKSREEILVDINTDILYIGNLLHPDLTIDELFYIGLKLIPCINSYGETSKKNRAKFKPFVLFIMQLFQQYWYNESIAQIYFCFIRVQCRTDDSNRILFTPFIAKIIKILKYHSNNYSVFEEGLRAIGNITLIQENNIIIHNYINDLITTTADLFYYENIAEAMLCALRGIARHPANKIILGNHINLFIKILNVHINNINIVNESLGLFTSIARDDNNRNKLKDHIKFLMYVCKIYVNKQTEFVFALFWELVYKNDTNKILLIPYIDLVFSTIISQIYNINIDYIKIGMGGITSMARNKECSIALQKYISHILYILSHLRQDDINIKTRKEFITYSKFHNAVSARAQSLNSSPPLKKLRSQKKTIGEQRRSLIVLNRNIWLRHISSFLSKNVNLESVNNIIVFGLTIIFMIIKNTEQKHIIIPYLDELFEIIKYYYKDLKIANYGIICIIQFVTDTAHSINYSYLITISKYIHIINQIMNYHADDINGINRLQNKIIIKKIEDMIFAINLIKRWWRKCTLV